MIIQTYRGYSIVRNIKPVPDRRHDWDWCHEDYDGPGDPRCGTGESVSDCIEQINEREA